MKKKLSCCLLSLFTFFACLPAEDMAFYFDEPGSLFEAKLESGEVETLVSKKSDAQISTKIKKFGEGSLEIAGPFSMDVPKGSLLTDSLGEAIDKMSLTLWLRLPEEGTKKGVVIANRTVGPGEAGRWGAGWVAKRLGLTFTNGSGPMVSMARKPHTVPIPPQTWTHLALVVDGQRVVFYVNGQEVETRELSSPGVPAVDEISHAHMQFLRGLPKGAFVDDFGYFGTTALTPDEIDAICQSGLRAFMESRRGKG